MASRPNSRWAIVDWRHFLAPASIVTVPRGELHFSRDITGTPVIVPCTGGNPGELIDDSMGNVGPGTTAEQENGEGDGANEVSTDGGGRAAPPAPLHKADRSFDVQKLQFLLIQIGFLRPSAIRFHTGIYGRHTMSAVGALQAVCGLNPTGQYDEATASALQQMARERTQPPSVDDHGALLGDVVGTAIYPSDLYQRMSDAVKSQDEVARTNGTVLEIQGTDIDGAGGEQRFRIWKEKEQDEPGADGSNADGSSVVQEELSRKAPGAAVVAAAQRKYEGQGKETAETQSAAFSAGDRATPATPRDPTAVTPGPAVAMSPEAGAASAAREVRTHRISASRTRRMVRDSEGLWDADKTSNQPACGPGGASSSDGRTSPRLGGGWREQIGAATAGEGRLTVVQGSLATLIPHEPVISGVELVARVNAMAGRVVAVETQQLQDARVLMQAFASTGHPSTDPTPVAEPEPEVESSTSGATISNSSIRNAVLWLPAELTELERSVLHGEAEQLGLGHVSIGEAQGRRLLLWKNHQFTATPAKVSAEPADSRRTDEFAEPVRRFDALPAAEQKVKTPKVAEGQDKVGPDHEALRVPVTNGRGREIVGNPAALIEVVEDASGKLVEGSRGFVLPKAWRVAAEPLTSLAEPLVNQHRSKAHKTTGILASFESVSQDYWSVCQNLNDSTAKAKRSTKVWESIELPSECSGERLLSSLGFWMTACGINDHSDSRLHGPMSRRLICTAFDRVDEPKLLLVDMLAWIAMAEQDGLETVDRYVAMGHFVLGALTGKKMLSKRAEADLRKQQATEAAPTPVKFTPTSSTSTGSARSQLTHLVSAALERSLESVTTMEEGSAAPPAGGMARLQLKGLMGLDGVGAPEKHDDDDSVLEQRAVEVATEVGLKCVSVVMESFQALEEHQETATLQNPQGAQRVMQSVFAMAVELLAELGHSWSENDALELLHWLVGGGELTAAACVAKTKDTLAVSMIEEILATGAGASKKAAKYVKQFGLSDRFAGIQAKQRRGKPHGNAHAEGSGAQSGGGRAAAAEIEMFSLPPCVPITDVSTIEQLSACTAALSGDIDGGSAGGVVCAIDAEWEPFSSSEPPTKVSLLQLATADQIFLVDMLAVATTDSEELQAFWHVLCTEILVVGFGISGDLTRICQSYPQLSRCFHRSVELQKVINALIASNVLDESVGRGLGGACQALLHKDVSKAEQTSHWGNRPLSASQRQYAATDAYVLLPLLVAALRALVGDKAAGLGQQSAESSSRLLSESLASVSQSLLKWVRPVTVSSSLTSGHGEDILSRNQLAPLGRAGVTKALSNLGLLESCPLFKSDGGDSSDSPGGSGVMCKTIALLAFESEVLLCVLRLGQRLQISRCASAIGLRRTDVRMCREDELVDMVGYPRGSIGPIGSRNGARGVLLDKELEGEGRLLCGAGEEGWVFGISAAVMRKVVPDCQCVQLR